VRPDLVAAQRHVDPLGEVEMAQLVRREIDRDAHLQAFVAPLPGPRAGLVDQLPIAPIRPTARQSG
jgi:hypothetical protein